MLRQKETTNWNILTDLLLAKQAANKDRMQELMAQAQFQANGKSRDAYGTKAKSK